MTHMEYPFQPTSLDTTNKHGIAIHVFTKSFIVNIVVWLLPYINIVPLRNASRVTMPANPKVPQITTPTKIYIHFLQTPFKSGMSLYGHGSGFCTVGIK